MSARRSPFERPKPQALTRLATGASVLAGVDGRSTGARRFRELLWALWAEATKQKRPFTQSEEMLARRAVALAMASEAIEGRMAKGDFVDLAEFAELTKTLRRVLQDIGIVEKI